MVLVLCLIKNFLRYGGYNNNLKEAEDYEIISKIIKEKKFIICQFLLSVLSTQKIFQNLEKDIQL